MKDRIRGGLAEGRSGGLEEGIVEKRRRRRRRRRSSHSQYRVWMYDHNLCSQMENITKETSSRLWAGRNIKL